MFCQPFQQIFSIVQHFFDRAGCESCWVDGEAVCGRRESVFSCVVFDECSVLVASAVQADSEEECFDLLVISAHFFSPLVVVGSPLLLQNGLLRHLVCCILLSVLSCDR